jgi:hypothetical protein
MTFFAITNYHRPRCCMICFILFVRLYSVYLISTKGARRVWPVSWGCLLLLGTWSYLRIIRRSVLPCTRFCICFLNFNYILHTVRYFVSLLALTRYRSPLAVTLWRSQNRDIMLWRDRDPSIFKGCLQAFILHPFSGKATFKTLIDKSNVFIMKNSQALHWKVRTINHHLFTYWYICIGVSKRKNAVLISITL